MKGWEATRLLLKKKFSRMGIEHCELNYKGCWRNNALSFAHSMKRRKITSQSDLEEVILACVPCHERLEHKSAEEMMDIVKETIRKREGIGVMFDGYQPQAGRWIEDLPEPSYKTGGWMEDD